MQWIDTVDCFYKAWTANLWVSKTKQVIMTTDFPALTQANNNNIRLRFINDNEIRTLNAEHAAKHRRCLFSGLSLLQRLPILKVYSKNKQMKNANKWAMS